MNMYYKTKNDSSMKLGMLMIFASMVFYAVWIVLICLMRERFFNLFGSIYHILFTISRIIMIVGIVLSQKIKNIILFLTSFVLNILLVLFGFFEVFIEQFYNLINIISLLIQGALYIILTSATIKKVEKDIWIKIMILITFVIGAYNSRNNIYCLLRDFFWYLGLLIIASPIVKFKDELDINQENSLSLENKLQVLKQRYKNGQISAKEYNLKRAEIISKL